MADNTTDELFVKNAVESSIRIGLILVLVTLSYLIMQPFLIPVLWGVIIAVAAAPLIFRLEHLLGNRRTLAATLFTIIALIVLIVPTVILSGSMVENVTEISESLKDGSLRIPPPPDIIATIPIIGARLDSTWFLASVNHESVIAQYAPQLKSAGATLLSALGSGLTSVLQFIAALIIAGIFLANSEGSIKASHTVARRVFGENGQDWAVLSAATIRSVVQGVLGIALIQAILAAMGLIAIDIPAAGLLSLLVFFIAIIQLPLLLILVPIAAYAFYYIGTAPAVIFLIWSILITMSDAFLKPMLLGRGVDIPMLVILLGAIGGLILAGIIGLFVGSVILALGFKLFTAWLDDDPTLKKRRKRRWRL